MRSKWKYLSMSPMNSKKCNLKHVRVPVARTSAYQIKNKKITIFFICIKNVGFGKLKIKGYPRSEYHFHTKSCFFIIA